MNSSRLQFRHWPWRKYLKHVVIAGPISMHLHTFLFLESTICETGYILQATAWRRPLLHFYIKFLQLLLSTASAPAHSFPNILPTSSPVDLSHSFPTILPTSSIVDLSQSFPTILLTSSTVAWDFHPLAFFRNRHNLGPCLLNKIFFEFC
jgi:hypothetical protein